MNHTLSLFWLIAVTAASAFQQQQRHPVVEWLKTKEGGFFLDEKVEFRGGGMFATESIARGEVVMVVPPSALLYDRDDDDEDEDDNDDGTCATALMLANEYYEDDDSEFAPYVKYLFEDFAHRELPMAWSAPAKRLVQTIVGGELEPLDFGREEENTYGAACSQDEDYWNYDEEFRHDLDAALRIVVSRGWHNVLVPGYDMVNHRNGYQWQNVDRSPGDLSVTGDYTIVALRDIRAGEQLHNSYNDCHDETCFGIGLTYVTPQIFNDYGFVEQYPTRWRFDNVGYLEDLTWQVDQDRETGMLTVEWFTYPPLDHVEQRNTMYNHWRRLLDMEEYIEESVKLLPHEFEQRAILNYHQALKTAFEQAWIYSEGEHVIPMLWRDAREQECAASLKVQQPSAQQVEGTVAAAEVSMDGTTRSVDSQVLYSAGGIQDGLENGADGNQDANPAAACDHPNNSHRSYDPLNADAEDTLNYQFHVAGNGCLSDRDEELMVEDFSSSRYSRLHFEHHYSHDTGDWNSCLQINEWLQSCTTFRPHYHELVVHYPASFVDTVKRVLFLGGGDIMIMHEILKYEKTLELVVGMELDQQVVRTSFRNTGIQPHFDHPAVHWAFGDATHSLLMMPPEWYGTFDLVIVDLQNFVFDTVMVTPELNIMDMAMKMVAPNGVISRNDDFVRRRNMEFAKYVVDIELHDVPRLCQQSLTVGSNGVDFLAKAPVNHGIETVFFDPTRGHNSSAWTNYRNHGDQYKGYNGEHDDSNNACPERVSADTTTENDASETSLSSKAHGLLLVVEAENVTLPLGVSTAVRGNIRQALVKNGFHEEKTEYLKVPEHGNSVLFTFQEGYVAARAQPEHQYVAFDLLLWTDFEKQYDVMQALVAAVGGNWNESTSYYSTVASGMHGLPKKEQQAQTKCNEALREQQTARDPSSTALNKPGEWDTVLAEMTSLLIQTSVSNKPVVVVLCADRSKPCKSLAALSSSRTVLPLWACDTLIINGTTEDEGNLLDCERQSRSVLMGSAGKIGGIVVDSAAPREMAQVFHKIVNNTSVRHELLGPDFVILDTAAQPWSNALLERVRTEMIQFNPVHHAETSFTNDGDVFKMGLFSVGDNEFYEHLMEAMAVIRSRTSLFGEVLDSKAGVVSYVPDFELSKVVTTDDYDLTDSQKQWQSQRHLAQQTFFRFEIQIPKPPLVEGDDVLINDEEHIWYGVWFSGRVVHVNADGTYDVVFNNGRYRSQMARHLLRKFERSSPSYKFGDRVLLRLRHFDEHPEVWYQASVTGIMPDGEYMLQIFSDNFGEMYAQHHDLIYQMEQPDSTLQSEITTATLFAILDRVIEAIDPSNDDTSETAEDDEDEEEDYEDDEEEEEKYRTLFTQVGDGCILALLWAPHENLVMSWDGKTRLDVNLFTTINDGEKAVAIRQEIEKAVTESIDYLVATSVDEQPRGIGRIVNNQRELDSFWFGQLDEFRRAGNPEDYEFRSSAERGFSSDDFDDDDDDEDDDDDDMQLWM